MHHDILIMYHCHFCYCYLNRLNLLYDDMNCVTEYYTDQHASPLVVLSTLKIMYFKG